LKTTPPPDPAPRLFEFGSFRLDPATRQLLRAGEPVHLTPRVFDTLVFLVEHRGRVLGKDELLAALWPGLVVEENNLGQAISKLRQALGEAPGDNRFIATLPGHGYRFVADVNEVEAADPAEPRANGEVPAMAEGRPSSRPLWLGALALAAVALLVAAVFLRSPEPEPGPAAHAGPPRTLAVLPFKPLVADAGDPALELGVADSLILELGAVGALSVQPLSAIRRFHDPATDPLAAGRALRVDAVLDGHLQRVEDRIRVSVRLLRVSDGQQLWADQFDEQLTGIFAIQDAISARVVAALALQLDEHARGRLARHSTDSAQAYEHYLRGRFHLSQGQPRQAAAMFEEAIALDPEYAAARAGLADVVSRLPIATDVASAAPMERARSEAMRALELDPELASAHAVLGWIGFYYDWDWPASEAHYRRALDLDGADFSARLGYAHLLSNTGRADEALEHVDHALALDPHSPMAGTLKSQFLLHGGREAEARAQLQETLANAPGFWIAQVMLGQLHLADGRLPEAIAAFENAAVSGSSWMPRALLAQAHAKAGDTGKAREILVSAQAARDPPVPPYILALLHLAVGEREQALAALERGHAERDVRMVFLGVAPVWQSLRDEPRFTTLLARMDLAPREAVAAN
jgi:DNA-binding winged helix-turn-helix (wHTH) protein/TolB-like protein/Flp pilus assembly protein TadD